MRENRNKKGVIIGIIGIFWNLTLAVIKLIIGFISHSISIQSDAINNFGDVVSSGATTVSFLASGKKADKEHPYGHGRIEYLVGMLIALMITFIGCQFLYNSVLKIINPSKIQFNWILLIVLIVSAGAKVGLGFIYIVSNKKIKSSTLKVAAVDSFQDAVITTVTIISFSLSNVVNFPIDGIAGVIVSIIIVINGIKIIKETIDPLIGAKTNPETVSRLKAILMSGENIIGIHDLLLHEYGANKFFASVHAEIPDSLSLNEAHKSIDKLEREIKRELNVDISIHIDPVDIDCEFSRNLKKEIRVLLQQYNYNIRMHGFDYIKEENKIYCDIEVPFGEKKAAEDIRGLLENIEKKENITIEFDIDYC